MCGSHEPESTAEREARIISVGIRVHLRAPGLRLRNLKDAVRMDAVGMKRRIPFSSASA